MTKRLFLCFFIFLISNCKSKKIEIETASLIKLNAGFYEIIPPAIFEGNSTVIGTMFLNNFKEKNINIKGFYFWNKFIKYKKSMGYSKVELNITLDNSVINKIPFTLKDSEIIILYEHKKREKFVKFNLIRKESNMNDVPMNSN